MFDACDSMSLLPCLHMKKAPEISLQKMKPRSIVKNPDTSDFTV